jgi:hypothetical protein
MKSSIFISKSQFLSGLQCPKSLYLHKNHPELMDEISESKEALFQSGREVSIIAQDLFPSGVTIPYDDTSLSKQLAHTRTEIAKGTDALYEAAFSYEGLFIKTDIIKKGKKGWELYEVKNSTKIKDLHLEDVAFQYYVLTKAGIPVSKACLVHINNQYVRNGDLEVDKLFMPNDLTEAIIDKQELIEEEIKRQREILSKGMPEIDVGEYCSDPYDCAFMGHCWQHIPEESVFTLKGRGIKQFDLYRQGIIHLKDVPLTSLPTHGKVQLECYLDKKSVINKEALKEFLNSIWYPLCFLDFETFMGPIPLYDGTKPYQQVPFQYSLHYLKDENAEPKHFEYLATPNVDPRKELIKKLLSEIPENACIVVYNMTFEKGILNNLKNWFPEYSERIDDIISNLRDLMSPFKNQDYYSWQMQGSYSIKAVLPALIPELNYDGLEITDGDMAMLAYKRMCESKDPSEIETIRKALLKYCRLDTIGMAQILGKLRESSN